MTVKLPIESLDRGRQLPYFKLRRQKLAAARAFEGSAVPDSALPIASATGFWEGSMNVLESMQERISSALAPVLDKDGILVPTPVLYPSNGNVVVYITGGLKSCVVSDRGDVLRTVRAHGVNIPNVNQWLGHTLKGSFLKASNGAITTGPIKSDDVLAGISLVARAASKAVAYAIETYMELDETPRPIHQTPFQRRHL